MWQETIKAAINKGNEVVLMESAKLSGGVGAGGGFLAFFSENERIIGLVIGALGTLGMIIFGILGYMITREKHKWDRQEHEARMVMLKEKGPDIASEPRE